MQLLKGVFVLCVCFAGVLAFITTVIAFGYLLKFLAAIGAVIGVLGLVGLLFYAALREFILEPREKHRNARKKRKS